MEGESGGVDNEKDVLWGLLCSLVEMNALINACGDKMPFMENIASGFISKNTNIAPDQYHNVLFQEMLSGGEMSEKIVSAFQDPKSVKNILKNMTVFMKCMDSEGEDMFNGLSEML